MYTPKKYYYFLLDVKKKMVPEFPKNMFKWMNDFPVIANQRPTWDEYFMLIAFIVSRRSSCLRNKVGAVIVKDRDTISTGYNGAPFPQQTCLEIGVCYRNVVSFQNKL